MKFFLSEAGFSIIQGLLLAGVVAGSSLVATRLLVDQKLAQKGAETRSAVEDLHTVVYAILQNGNNCEQTILTNESSLPNLRADLGSTVTAKTNLIFELDEINATGGQVIIEKNKAYINNSLKVVDITLGAETATGRRELSITYERLNSSDSNAATRTKKGYGAKRIRKTIPLTIKRNEDNNFLSCHAHTEAKGIDVGNVDLAKEFCQEMIDSSVSENMKALQWDEDRKICKLNTECEGRLFVGISDKGEVQCKSLAEWFDFELVIDNTPPIGCKIGDSIAYLHIDQENKKVSIKCARTDKPGEAPCPAQTIAWSDAYNCSGELSERGHGDTQLIYGPTTPPGVGVSSIYPAIYQCNDGSWSKIKSCCTDDPSCTL